MIDPIIFTIEIGDLTLNFRWYGLLIAIGVAVAAWVAERQVAKRGGNPDLVWDGLIWVLPAAIIGARLWYVLNEILGGGRQYLDDPGRIFQITEGGLHIFGAFIFGLLAALIYTRRKRIDLLLLLDAIAPALLIVQALARPANFINQELYGPPTELPWGIPIEAAKRLPPWNNLELYPVESTRFHPTFAYEMIWNLLAASLLLWLARRFPDKLKPGASFAAWLVLAGVGRVVIEAFRPDQPLISGTSLSYSRLVAILMAIGGAFWLLVRYEIIRVPRLSAGPEQYRLKKPSYKSRKKKN
ncbi:MAG: prolipoprotein diacylglyceryl transferase [Anaerolineales bacterium]|nr:prolipoprotein diacylglyceryl transferase [Anaerolineales bacterium]